MNPDDYPAVLARFMAAKSARDAALKKERTKLDKAQAEYAAAVDCAESVAYEEARVELTALRRWAVAQNPVIKLTNPMKEEG